MRYIKHSLQSIDYNFYIQESIDKIVNILSDPSECYLANDKLKDIKEELEYAIKNSNQISILREFFKLNNLTVDENDLCLVSIFDKNMLDDLNLYGVSYKPYNLIKIYDDEVYKLFIDKYDFYDLTKKYGRDNI